MTPATPDRRARRREQTRAEILDLALDEMATAGVAGLSLSTVARRLGVRPPSLYKYFPSRHAVYDALFARGHRDYLAAARAAVDGAEPGLAAIGAAFEAGARWIVANPTLAQLLYWRPVPGYVPSAEAYAPAVELGELMTDQVRAAVRRGELHRDAASPAGLDLLRSLIAGVASQQLANEPDATYETGRFTRLVPRLPALFAAAYPPGSR